MMEVEMTRWAAVPIVVGASIVAGCTPSYRVHVNTFAEPNHPVNQGAAVYVVPEPNSANPILRRQVEAKVRELLSGHGYRPVDTPDTADYLLTFHMGIHSNEVMGYAPVYRPYGGFYGGYFGHWGLGYATYLPYYDTIYVHWLRVKLYTKDGGALNEANVVWFGEAQTGTDDPELRQAVNYLLVALMDYFGTDTRRWVAVTLKRNDPRVQGIMEVQGQ